MKKLLFALVLTGAFGNAYAEVEVIECPDIVFAGTWVGSEGEKWHVTPEYDLVYSSHGWAFLSNYKTCSTNEDNYLNLWISVDRPYIDGMLMHDESMTVNILLIQLPPAPADQKEGVFKGADITQAAFAMYMPSQDEPVVTYTTRVFTK